MPTQTQTSNPSDWYSGLLQNYFRGAIDVANRPYQQYMGPQVAGMSSITQGALGGIQGAMYGNPATWGGMGLLGDVIGGRYGNPYMDQMAQTITADANKSFDRNLGQLNSIFDNPNSFGGARHGLMAGDLAENFGRGLGTSLGQLRYSAFNDDINRRMMAAQSAQGMNNAQMQNLALAAQMGSIPRNIQQEFYNAQQQNWNNQFNYPIQQTSNLGNWLGLGGNGNAGRTQTNYTPDPNRASQILGGLGTLSPFLFGQTNSAGQTTQGFLPWAFSGLFGGR